MMFVFASGSQPHVWPVHMIHVMERVRCFSLGLPQRCNFSQYEARAFLAQGIGRVCWRYQRQHWADYAV